MALFKSRGSKQILNFPFGFGTMTRLDTQSVGSVTGATIFYFYNVSSVSLSYLFYTSGTLRGA